MNISKQKLRNLLDHAFFSGKNDEYDWKYKEWREEVLDQW